MAPGLFENTTSGVGPAPAPVGTIRIDPETVVGGSPEVENFCDVRLGMEYAKELLVWPPMVTLTGAPAGFKNCTVPVNASVVGFTRKTLVVQPPPSAKWRTVVVPFFGATVVSMTGCVDIRKSLRSFVNPRKATTATGTLEV